MKRVKRVRVKVKVRVRVRRKEKARAAAGTIICISGFGFFKVPSLPDWAAVECGGPIVLSRERVMRQAPAGKGALTLKPPFR